MHRAAVASAAVIVTAFGCFEVTHAAYGALIMVEMQKHKLKEEQQKRKLEEQRNNRLREVPLRPDCEVKFISPFGHSFLEYNVEFEFEKSKTSLPSLLHADLNTNGDSLYARRDSVDILESFVPPDYRMAGILRSGVSGTAGKLRVDSTHTAGKSQVGSLPDSTSAARSARTSRSKSVASGLPPTCEDYDKLNVVKLELIKGDHMYMSKYHMQALFRNTEIKWTLSLPLKKSLEWRMDDYSDLDLLLEELQKTTASLKELRKTKRVRFHEDVKGGEVGT